MQTRLLALAIAAGLATPNAAEVLTVDPGSPDAFTTIQAAVDAASNGDLIRIEPQPSPEIYAGFEVVGKSLDFIASNATVSGNVTVSSLSAGQQVTLRRLRVVPQTPWLTEPLLTAEDIDGVLWIEDCTFGFGNYFYNNAPSPPPAVRIANVGQVILSNTNILGGAGGAGQFDIGAAAVEASGSAVYAFGGDAEGGRGAATGPGGAAFLLADSSIFVQNTTLTGGTGGNYFQGTGSAGGAGIQFTGNGELWLRGASVAGGLGGLGAGFVNGPNGEPLVLDPAIDLYEQAAALRRIIAPSSVQADGIPGLMILDAEPGDLVVLFVEAVLPPLVFADSIPGPVAVGPSPLVLFAGAQVAGNLSSPVPAPPLPGALSHLSWVFQAAFVDPTGSITVSNPTRVQLQN